MRDGKDQSSYEQTSLSRPTILDLSKIVMYEYPGVYDDTMKEDLTKRIDALNDELATKQESIDLLKGRLENQIMSFKETIAKVLDKDTSLGEKIRTLFREQGITIASILTAVGMAIRVLVEALLPGSGGGCCHGIRWRRTTS